MEAYKERMKVEYMQLKDRVEKLHQLNVKVDAGVLDFNPACPRGLLRDQESAMKDYLRILEIRAVIENVPIWEDEADI